jgi:hypothetical protein
MNWDSIRIWSAILLLLDAAFGLWNSDRVQALAPKLNIPRIALMEGLIALLLVLAGLL